MDKQELPDVLTVPQAAKHLQVTAQMVYNMIDAGQLQSFRLGRLIRIRRADLESLIENLLPPAAFSMEAPIQAPAKKKRG